MARQTLRQLETCNSGCAAALREDRAHGLIYGPFYLEGYGFVQSYHAAAASKRCTYCGADLPRRRGRRILERLENASDRLRLAIVAYW